MKIFMSLAAYLLFCFAVTSSVIEASASEYPGRPIEMVIPFDPGTDSDLVGRLAAELAQEYLGTKIIISNKPGGGGAAGFTYIRNAKPDGYLIGMGTSNLVSHKIFGNLPFDHNDVEIVLLIHTAPIVLCVPVNSEFHTLDDLMTAAKKRPGNVSWATGGQGSILHAATVDFMRNAEIKLKIVPSGGGNAQPVLFASGGHVDASFTSIVPAKGQLEAGLLRPLAVYGHSRIGVLPDVPTFGELGYPVQVNGIRGIITPPGVAEEKLKILHDAFEKAIERQEYIDFVTNGSGIVLNASGNDAMKLLETQKKAFEAVAASEQD